MYVISFNKAVHFFGTMVNMLFRIVSRFTAVGSMKDVCVIIIFS